MKKNLTEEEMMAVNSSSELHRKAMIRAAKENRRNIETAGKSLYILVRLHTDNIIHRRISTVIAVSEKRESLEQYFHDHYFPDIEFNESGYTQTIATDMGEGCFQLKKVAFV